MSIDWLILLVTYTLRLKKMMAVIAIERHEDMSYAADTLTLPPYAATPDTRCCRCYEYMARRYTLA